MDRAGRVAVPHNPDLPLRVSVAQRNKWAVQQHRPTDLNDAAATSAIPRQGSGPRFTPKGHDATEDKAARDRRQAEI
jgi:hypothetical protein